jgi:hypothetical protein
MCCPLWFPHKTLENTEGIIKNEQSREPGNKGHTRRRQTKQKHNAICFGHHNTQTNTLNVNKTCEPSYKQLEVKTNRTSSLCGNRNGHHTTELSALCFCFVCLRLVCPLFPGSLDCSFLMIPSVFSNVYLYSVLHQNSVWWREGRVVLCWNMGLKNKNLNYHEYCNSIISRQI